MSNSGRVVVATYCDDIRYELGGKYSLIGCYKQDLIVSKMPIVIPKLCISVTVVTPIDILLEKLSVCARLGQDSLGELEVPENELEAVRGDMSEKVRSGMKMAEVMCHLAFSPFFITQESRLRVEAVTEAGVINGTGLQIRLAKLEERTAFGEQ
jgi:hypothetical protein